MPEFAPTDKWPRHPKPWWRDALDMARDYGWSLTQIKGHGWGHIYCPARSCDYPIYSSGTAPEGPAKTARRKVERCPHGTVAAESVSHIEALLTKAERLIDAADALSLKNKLERRAELLDAADDLVSQSAAWDEFGLLLAQAEDAEQEAAAAFAAAGERHDAQAGALDAADGQVRSARDALQRPRLPSGEVKRLKGWADELRARIVAARSA
ncbi:hypothetical protein [Nostocoides vanveenii]|uniref:hypothetical protein n=1 Tax=Nostocoides vanveenii TaxID=330835 RepID=UPI0031E30CE4